MDDGSLFSIGDDDDDDDDDNDDDGDINGLATPVTHPKCKALLLLGNTERLLIAKAISEVGGEERVGRVGGDDVPAHRLDRYQKIIIRLEQVYGGEGPSTPINKVSSDKTMPAPAALP